MISKTAVRVLEAWKVASAGQQSCNEATLLKSFENLDMTWGPEEVEDMMGYAEKTQRFLDAEGSALSKVETSDDEDDEDDEDHKHALLNYKSILGFSTKNATIRSSRLTARDVVWGEFSRQIDEINNPENHEDLVIKTSHPSKTQISLPMFTKLFRTVTQSGKKADPKNV